MLSELDYASPETCRRMVAHYEAQASNWTKPASWHALARMSATEWRGRLARAEELNR